MNLKNRLSKLEAESGGKDKSGECGCMYPGAFDVRYYENAATSRQDAEADTRPAGRCGVCGGERRIIKVVLVENWRAAA